MALHSVKNPCTACRHHRSKGERIHVCLARANEIVWYSSVTGKPVTYGRTDCYLARDYGGACKPQGLMFAPSLRTKLLQMIAALLAAKEA